MVYSSLVWQWLSHAMSVTQITVVIFGTVLLGAYLATLWQSQRAVSGRH